MSNTKHLADLMKVCSILPVFAVMPAMADLPKVSGNAWVFGDLQLDSKADKSVIGGRVHVVNGERGNDLPNYNVVGRSIKLTGDKDAKMNVYVGPVNMVLRELATDEKFVYNWQKPSKTGETNWQGEDLASGEISYEDVDIAAQNGIVWGDSVMDVLEKTGWPVADNYPNMAAGISLFANRDANVVAGSLEVENTNLTLDGSKLVAQNAKVSNSDIHVVNSVVPNEFLGGGRNASDGKTVIETKDLVFQDNTRIVVDAGAELNLSDAGNVIIRNNTYADDHGNGGAIYNQGTMTFRATDFTGNSSLVDGGAIYNNGGTLNINGGNFENNRASQNGWDDEGYAGAIFDKGELKIVGTETDKVSFEQNVGYSGGAIYGSKNTSKGMTITNAEFEDNHAVADAGALGIFNDAKSVLTNVDFEDNTVAVKYGKDVIKLEDITEADGGGAIQLGQLASATLNNVHFEHNISGVRGGAISARHFGDEVLEINNSDFEHNISYTQGGAIANGFAGKVVSNSVDYMSNIAYESGGAIYNGSVPNFGGAAVAKPSTGDGILEFAGVNRFENNHAGQNGGAIFNGEKGTVIFNGTNTFVNNTVGEKYGANDIHNLGSVTVASGTTKLSGGVTGNGTFTIDNGAELYIGSSTISQGSIVINGDVYADVLTDGSSKYIDRADKEENVRENNTGTYAKLYGNVSGNGSINLNIGTVGTYKMFNKAIDDELADNITAGKAYDIDVINGTDVKVTLKSVETLAEDSGLSQKAAGAISSLASSSNRNIQMVSLAAQKLLNSGDVDAVAKIEQETAKLNPEDKPVTQSVATSLNNQVLSLTAGRMSGGAPVIGRSGGDESVATNGFWAQGLYNKSKSGSAFDGTTRGFALGADTLIDNKYTLGAGFAYNNTDMSSGTRDTEIDSKTLFVYGQYKPSNWFANATLAYTMSEYTEDTDPFGIAVESTYDVDVYGAQLMAGYDFATGITPEMGLRYLHIAQDEYSNGVNTIAASDTDFLTAVAGLKYAFYVETENMLKFRPELRAALTYDVINDGSHTTVMLPSVGASYNVDGQALNKLGGEFGIGLTAEYKGLEFSLMYDLDVHEDYTSQTGMIKFRSQF